MTDTIVTHSSCAVLECTARFDVYQQVGAYCRATHINRKFKLIKCINVVIVLAPILMLLRLKDDVLTLASVDSNPQAIAYYAVTVGNHRFELLMYEA